MADALQYGSPLHLNSQTAQVLTPQPVTNNSDHERNENRRNMNFVRTPSFIQRGGTQQGGGLPHPPKAQGEGAPHEEGPALPFGTQLGGKKKFSFGGLFESAIKPLDKIKDFSIKDLKVDDLLLIGLALILLNEKSDYDILLVLAYLFIVGL